MIRYFLLAIFIFSSTILSAQKLDNQLVHKNKSIPGIVKQEIREALNHYPELINTPIDFIFNDNIKSAFMVAQPKWYGVFQRKVKRAYVIKMGRYFKLKDKLIPIEELPGDVLAGWIAHELGHIMDYKEKSGISMIGLGIRYITSNNFMIRTEQKADVFAINNGLGDYILKTKHFILEHDDIPLTYKRKIKRFYMSPEMVAQLMEDYAEETDDDEI